MQMHLPHRQNVFFLITCNLFTTAIVCVINACALQNNKQNKAKRNILLLAFAAVLCINHVKLKNKNRKIIKIIDTIVESHL